MEKHNNNIAFGILQIVTEEFAMLPEPPKEIETFKIHHELFFGLGKEQKRIQVRKYARFEKEDGNPFMVIAVACTFEIQPESWSMLASPDSDTLVVPRDFAIHLAMVTVGTLRGVLHAKTENTPYNRFLFPPLNVVALVPEVLSFD
ncbi:hypothetical protein [Persicitalea sp.]|uniref:hypothetical protein n=1 Tax=Persicitalea sp. TaxID=3100273 RepID=UPI00359430CE